MESKVYGQQRPGLFSVERVSQPGEPSNRRSRVYKQREVVEMIRAPRRCAERNQRCGNDEYYPLRLARTESTKVQAPKKSSRPTKPTNARERQDRLLRILSILDEMFPDVTCALHHSNAWELLVATILSAQCTDERVNKVTPGLFRKYPTMTDFANVSHAELAKDIHSTGFFNNKAKSIIGAARKLLADFGGKIPRDIGQLLTVPGAARKTANVVLGTAFGIASGVVVDTHVSRIAQRLDLTKETTPEKIERDLMAILPQDRWIRFSHQIIHHGRGLCKARTPSCGECPLNTLCYAEDRTV